MEGLDKIRQFVLENARRDADKILDDAKQEAKLILQSAEEEAAQLDTELDSLLKQQAEEDLARRRALDAVDKRRIVLEERQRLVDDCLDLVKEQLAHLSPEARRDFYIRLLKVTAKDGQTIHFAKAEEAIANEVLSAVEVDLELGDFDAEAEGGFILREDKVTWRFTYEALIERDLEHYIELIAKVLFAKEDGDLT